MLSYIEIIDVIASLLCRCVGHKAHNRSYISNNSLLQHKCGRHSHVHSCKEDFEFDPRPGILKESPNTETRADRGCGRQSEAAAAAVHDGRVIDSAAVGIPPRLELLLEKFHSAILHHHHHQSEREKSNLVEQRGSLTDVSRLSHPSPF